jgi:hypothetical protein
MTSKADRQSRHRGIGFKVGQVFSADDPIARWATVLAMATNNTIYLNVRLIEGNLPPELSMYYFRLVAAHFFEAANWLSDTRSTWPEVDQFIKTLESSDQERFDRITEFASQRHRFYENLSRSRSTLFHYPTMHPARDAAGAEELANAMREVAEADGWIEGGDDYASFRATFADEVALQFLSTSNQENQEIMEELRGPVFELVEFAEAVLLAHLKTIDKDATTIWEKGKPRPEIPAASDS